MQEQVTTVDYHDLAALRRAVDHIFKELLEDRAGTPDWVIQVCSEVGAVIEAHGSEEKDEQDDPRVRRIILLAIALHAGIMIGHFAAEQDWPLVAGRSGSSSDAAAS